MVKGVNRMDKQQREIARTRRYLEKVSFDYEPENPWILCCGVEKAINCKISVVMPTYNRKVEQIDRSVQSVLAQTWKNFRFIILDNGTDAELSRTLCDYVKELQDERVLLYKNAVSVPMFRNWNRCFYLAESEWVTMVHDDDFLAPEHLSVMNKAIEQIPNSDGICCAHRVVDMRKGEEKQPMDSGPLDQLVAEQIMLQDNLHCFCRLMLGAVLKRDSIIDIGGFESGKSIIEDYVMMSRMIYNYNLYYIEKKLYNYCWANNLSLQIKWQDEIVWEYYFRHAIAQTMPAVFRPIFRKCVKLDTEQVVKIYESDKSIFGKPYYFDHVRFCSDCGLRSLASWKITKKFFGGVSWRLEKFLARNRKKYNIELMASDNG